MNDLGKYDPVLREYGFRTREQLYRSLRATPECHKLHNLETMLDKTLAGIRSYDAVLTGMNKLCKSDPRIATIANHVTLETVDRRKRTRNHLSPDIAARNPRWNEYLAVFKKHGYDNIGQLVKKARSEDIMLTAQQATRAIKRLRSTTPYAGMLDEHVLKGLVAACEYDPEIWNLLKEQGLLRKPPRSTQSYDGRSPTNKELLQ